MIGSGRRQIILVIVIVLSAVFFLTGQLYFCGWADAAEIEKVTSDSDKITAFEDVTIEETVKGNVVVLFGDAEINAPVGGDVVVIFGDLYLNSKVSGNVVSFFGAAKLGAGSEISGDIITTGNYVRSPGAIVKGREDIFAIPEIKFNANFLFAAGVSVIIIGSILLLIAGLLLLLLLKDKIASMTDSMNRQPFKNIIYGFLSFLAASFLTSVLFITLAVPAIYLVLVAFSGTLASVFLGRMFLGTLGMKRRIYLEFLTGLVFITLVKVLFFFLIAYGIVPAGIVLYLIFTFFVYSLGMGVLIGMNASSPGKSNTAKAIFVYIYLVLV